MVGTFASCVITIECPTFLLLTRAVCRRHCDHYVGRGVMQRFESGAELAKAMGLPTRALKQTFDDYNTAADKKSDAFGKQFFRNAHYTIDDSFHVAQVDICSFFLPVVGVLFSLYLLSVSPRRLKVTPVVHYTMGGLRCNEHAEVLDKSGTPIPGKKLLFRCCASDKCDT